MNKFGKLLVVGGIVASMAFTAGCGDDKKPADTKKSVASSSSQKSTQKPAEKKPASNAPAIKAPENANWRYPSYIKTEADTPKMTPEIQKIVDECYAEMTLHKSEKGKLLNDSKINANDKRDVRDLWFHAKGENHDNNNKFKNSKGKDVSAQEVYHIKFIVDKDTSAIKRWIFYKYVVSPEEPDGKTITIKEVK